jgi:hypothetical protein
MKTSELIGPDLDWAVAKAKGVRLSALQDHGHFEVHFADENGGEIYSPSTDWAQGGPIIEREKIATVYRAGEYWLSYTFDGAEFEGIGPTPLVAAMRCYVSSKLGNEIDVPEGLK